MTLIEMIQHVTKTDFLPGKLYDHKTGAVAVPYGQDGGTVRYLICRYDCIGKKWRIGKQSQPLPDGEWKAIIAIDERQLAEIAVAAYQAAA